MRFDRALEEGSMVKRKAVCRFGKLLLMRKMAAAGTRRIVVRKSVAQWGVSSC